jgi:hypothetical protein
MVTKVMGWVSITALLMVVSWCPFASYQIPLHFVVCAGSVFGVVALFFIKQEIEIQCGIDSRSTREASHCKTAS